MIYRVDLNESDLYLQYIRSIVKKVKKYFVFFLMSTGLIVYMERNKRVSC